MSAVVTSAAVSAVTQETFYGSGAFSLCMLLMLACVLLAREISAPNSRQRPFARGLDLGIVPLILCFGIMIVLHAGIYAGW
jgi:hypothetical protein